MLKLENGFCSCPARYDSGMVLSVWISALLSVSTRNNRKINTVGKMVVSRWKKGYCSKKNSDLFYYHKENVSREKLIFSFIWQQFAPWKCIACSFWVNCISEWIYFYSFFASQRASSRNSTEFIPSLSHWKLFFRFWFLFSSFSAFPSKMSR